MAQNAKQQLTRSQHYVPRFYLRGFEGPRGVWVFDKTTERKFCAAPENIAQESWFYEIPEKFNKDSESSIQKNTIERYLSDIEGRFAPFFKHLIINLSLAAPSYLWSARILTSEIKVLVSEFFALQMLRTKDYRLSMREMIQKLEAELLKIGPIAPELRSQFDEMLDPDFEPVMHMGILFDGKTPEMIARTLAAHIWIILVNTTSSHLWTSDNPILRLPHVRHPILGMSGVQSPGIEIAFPLSPRFMLCMLEEKYWRPLAERDGRAFRMSDQANIEYYNSQTLANATRQVYSYYDDFELAERICSENPAFAHRPRVVVGGK